MFLNAKVILRFSDRNVEVTLGELSALYRELRGVFEEPSAALGGLLSEKRADELAKYRAAEVDRAALLNNLRQIDFGPGLNGKRD